MIRKVAPLIFVLATNLILANLNAQAETKVNIGGRDYVIYAEMYNRVNAISLCQTHSGKLVAFDNIDHQETVAGFLYTYDWPYVRAYWTEGLRSSQDPRKFVWESSGAEFDASLQWQPNEPSPDFSKICAFFLAETVGMVLGDAVNTHSVICQLN